MNFLNSIFKYKENFFVNGLTNDLIGLYILNYKKKFDEDLIVLTHNLYEANNLYKTLNVLDKDVLFYPTDDFITSIALAQSPDLKIKRLETISILKNRSKNKNKIVITSLMGYLKYLPNPKQDIEFTIADNDKKISREILLQKLEEYGYTRVSLVTSTGEYAVRGFIIDIFPIEAEHPIRIEFFDEDLEQIKTFNENNQLTIKNIKSVKIKRFNEKLSFEKNKYSLLDYLNSKTVFLINEKQIITNYKLILEEIKSYNETKNIKNFDYMFDLYDLKPSKSFKINTLDKIDGKNVINYNSKGILNFNRNFSELKKFISSKIKNNTIIFTVEEENQKKKLLELFEHAVLTNFSNIFKNSINVVESNLKNGFTIDNYIVITPRDIENVKKIKINYRNNIKMGKITSYEDLKIGDYIVHEMHGIGIYNGLKTLERGSLKNDYIQLIYKDNDKVYIPISNINSIYKYNFAEGKNPKLDKLNSTSWARKKASARKRIEDISEELIELYSKRNNIKIAPYKDYDEEIEFALNFPYTLTRDQEKSIKEIDHDLKSTIPMDRLLCGDVGFGKTEVAFRAMFKAIINGYQVAYLCPTTILSKQQYDSAIERFKNFPIRIELLNRFVKPSKVKKILEDLKHGKVDLVIGTHKLFNQKIEYKNLNLLVVDEEQRFGVKHKEKIKQIKSDINVLTMSATPIPRTLKMALSGVRNLSIIETPPINRYPIQTYVIEENHLVLKEAIYKEISRGGQIFILLNNISKIDKVLNKIKKLVPEASVNFAHGQMSSDKLDNVMQNFINHEFDILVCTTIIETGIDIPNVNSIIIYDADRFGLSQLYQIRGRVGRSNKIAYCYLFYNPKKILSEIATKRLNSIKEFTELGSGYKIAMRDLAIRGAGNLLGVEQAGFIESIGIDLYTKMINEVINKTSENNNSVVHLNVSNHIKDEYVDDEAIKIEIHKLINSIKSKKDLLKVKNELIDRFGKFDESINIYLYEKYVESLIDLLDIKVSNIYGEKINLILPESITKRIDGEKLFIKMYDISKSAKLKYINNKISILIDSTDQEKSYIYVLTDILDYLNTI